MSENCRQANKIRLKAGRKRERASGRDQQRQEGENAGNESNCNNGLPDVSNKRSPWGGSARERGQAMYI